MTGNNVSDWLCIDLMSTTAQLSLTCLCVFLCLCVRIAVFSVTVFYDERVVIVAEQRPDASEEDSFQWMSRVLQVKMEKCIIFKIYINPKIVNKCSPSVLVSPPQTITTQQTSFLMCGFLYRLLTASIRWASTVWLWSQPTPYLKHLLEGSTSLTPSSSS